MPQRSLANICLPGSYLLGQHPGESRENMLPLAGPVLLETFPIAFALYLAQICGRWVMLVLPFVMLIA